MEHAPAGRDFAASVERGLHLAIGVVILAKTAVFAAALTGRTSYDVVDVLCCVAVVVCVSVAGARCVAGRPGALDVGLCAAALVAGTLLHRGTVPLAGAADSPIVHLVEPMLLVVAARLPAGTILGLAGGYVLLRWSTGGDATALRYGVEEATFITGTVLAVLVLVGLMRGSSTRAEEALRAERARRAAATDRAELEATAFLHDDLVPALLSVASMPDAEPTAATAAAALAGLTADGTSLSRAPLAEQIRAAVDDSGLEVALVERGRSTALPDPVRDALVGAVREALRNVARHSGQRRCRVTLSQRPGRVRITVEDDGSGFMVTPGVGLRIAITGRVEAAGGTATVASTPGRGTTVALSWQVHRIARLLGLSPDTDVFARAAVGRPGQAALQVCGVLAAGYAATGLLLLIDGTGQPATWAGAALTALLVVAIAARIDRGPAPASTLVAGAVVPAAILAVALPTVSADGLGGLESWLVEFTALPAMVLAWTTSRRMLVLLLLPNAVAIAVVADRMGVPLAELPHLLFVQPLNTFFVAVIIGVCRRAGLVLADAAAGSAAIDRGSAVRRTLGPLLPAVQRSLAAPERVDPSDAAALAQAVRDCLYLPGVAHLALRTELYRLRQAGTHVVLTLREEIPGSPALTALIAALRTSAPARLTLSGDATETTVVAVPGIDEAAATALARVVPASWAAAFDPDATMLSGPPRDAELSRPGDRQLARG